MLLLKTFNFERNIYKSLTNLIFTLTNLLSLVLKFSILLRDWNGWDLYRTSSNRIITTSLVRQKILYWLFHNFKLHMLLALASKDILNLSKDGIAIKPIETQSHGIWLTFFWRSTGFMEFCCHDKLTQNCDVYWVWLDSYFSFFVLVY